ncbi:ribonuclease P protein subunit [Candidatus Woesearchaeota archaeon]|nr:ribonuclease P protein subunit [Candidatus Woesearchaeota archaeon]
MKELVQRTWIGLEIAVVEARNKSLVGLKGKVVDESKEMLTVQTATGEKKVVKEQARFQVHDQGKQFLVDGKLLVGRPEERIKKRFGR